MAILAFLTFLVFLQISNRDGIELDIPGERLIRGSHERVEHVIAVAIPVPKANRGAVTFL
jgi:hypothetical protein